MTRLAILSQLFTSGPTNLVEGEKTAGFEMLFPCNNYANERRWMWAQFTEWCQSWADATIGTSVGALKICPNTFAFHLDGERQKEPCSQMLMKTQPDKQELQAFLELWFSCPLVWWQSNHCLLELNHYIEGSMTLFCGPRHISSKDRKLLNTCEPVTLPG